MLGYLRDPPPRSARWGSPSQGAGGGGVLEKGLERPPLPLHKPSFPRRRVARAMGARMQGNAVARGARRPFGIAPARARAPGYTRAPSFFLKVSNRESPAFRFLATFPNSASSRILFASAGFRFFFGRFAPARPPPASAPSSTAPSTSAFFGAVLSEARLPAAAPSFAAFFLALSTMMGFPLGFSHTERQARLTYLHQEPGGGAVHCITGAGVRAEWQCGGALRWGCSGAVRAPGGTPEAPPAQHPCTPAALFCCIEHADVAGAWGGGGVTTVYARAGSSGASALRMFLAEFNKNVTELYWNCNRPKRECRRNVTDVGIPCEYQAPRAIL